MDGLSHTEQNRLADLSLVLLSQPKTVLTQWATALQYERLQTCCRVKPLRYSGLFGN